MAEIRANAIQEQLVENDNSIELKNKITEYKTAINSLRKKKKKIILELEEKELSKKEIAEIKKILQREEILEAILVKKGISVNNEEYDQEYQEIINEVGNYQKNNKDKSVLEAIEALYSIQVEYKEDEKPEEIAIEKEDLENIQNNVSEMPEKIIGSEENNQDRALKAPEDVKITSEVELFSGSFKEESETIDDTLKRNKALDIMKKEVKDMPNEDELDICFLKEDDNINFIVYQKVKDLPVEEQVRERITLYKDLTQGKYYASEHVLKEFAIKDLEDKETIDDNLYYQISEKDALKLLDNEDEKYEVIVNEIEKKEEELKKYVFYYDLDNDKEVYVLKDTLKELKLIPVDEGIVLDGDILYQIDKDDSKKVARNSKKKNYEIEKKEIHLGKKVVNEDGNSEEDSVEIVPFYLDDNNCVFVSRTVLNKFNITPYGDAVRINDRNCFQLFEEDIEYILEHQNKGRNPYVVNYLSANFQEIEEKDEITIFRDKNHDNKLYAGKDIFFKFGLAVEDDFVIINEIKCYPISDENFELIKNYVKKSDYTEITINYVDVELDDEVINANRKVLKNLVKGLVVIGDDKSSYSSLHAISSKKFNKELKDNILFNIVYSIPTVGDCNDRFLNRISRSLLSSKKAEDVLDCFDKKLEQLTEDDILILRKEYNDSEYKNKIVADIRRRIENVIR